MIARFAVAASLAADAIAFYVLAEWLASAYEGSSPDAVGVWAFLLVALVSGGLPKLLAWYGFDGKGAYLGTILFAIVLLYAIIRIEILGDVAIWDMSWLTDFLSDTGRSASESGQALFAAILLLGCWIRISYRAADDIEMEMVPRSVGWAFVLVTALVVIGAASDRSGEVARAGALFYVVAVLALACSQLALSGATIGEGKAGGIVGMLLGGTLAVTVVGVLLFGLLFGVLAPVLGPIIGAVVQGVLTVLLTPVAWVLTRLFDALFQGSNPFENLNDAAINQAREANEPQSEDRSLWQQWMTYALRGFALIVILAAVTGAIALYMRIRRTGPSRRDNDAAVSLVGSAGDDLRSFFRSLLPKRANKPVPFASTATTRLYLDVLQEAESDGAVRQAGETPAEFQPTLASKYRADVTAEITQAFEQARYAGRELDPRLVEELRRRWRTVR